MSCATNANREVDCPNSTPSVKGVGLPRMEQNINEMLLMSVIFHHYISNSNLCKTPMQYLYLSIVFLRWLLDCLCFFFTGMLERICLHICGTNVNKNFLISYLSKPPQKHFYQVSTFKRHKWN